MNEEKKTITEISDDEVISRFGVAEKEEYIDPRLADAKRARSLLNFWNNANTALIDAREGFHLSEKWDDKDLRKQYLDNGRVLIKRIKTIEDELRILLPRTKNIKFLSDNEVALLTTWMLSLLEIKVE